MSAGSRSRSDRVFIAVVTAGIVVGALLTVYEIAERPPVELRDERVRVDDDLVAHVQVLVQNRSDDTAYCVEVRVAALDSEGLDLQDAGATPARGDGRLGPRESMNFTATLDGLSQQDYDEELDEFEAYVDRYRAC